MSDSPSEPPPPKAAAMDPRLLESLVCPLTHGPLEYDSARAALISPNARLVFPIRDGVPIMLEHEATSIKE